MHVLTSGSIADLFTKCFEKPDYRAAIVLSSRSSMVSFYDEIRNELIERALPGVKAIDVHHHSLNIRYLNGSLVDIFVASDRIKMKRHHDIVFEDGISIETQKYILEASIVPYSEPEEDDFDTSDLDELLNTFKTIL